MFHTRISIGVFEAYVDINRPVLKNADLTQGRLTKVYSKWLNGMITFNTYVIAVCIETNRL